MAFHLLNLFKPKLVCNSLLTRGLHSIVKETNICSESKALQTCGAPKLFVRVFNLFGITSVRNNVRNHFPRPQERKRVLRHGWRKRMLTIAGRKIIMNRILKGRHVITH